MQYRYREEPVGDSINSYRLEILSKGLPSSAASLGQTYAARPELLCLDGLSADDEVRNRAAN